MNDPFAALVSDPDFDTWLRASHAMTDAEEAAFAREYAEAECATARFEQQFPHLAD